MPEDKGEMKFASARQRRYMFAVVPDAAKKWAHGRKTRPSDWRKRKPSRTYVSAVVAAGYKDTQRRDGEGKWTDTGGGIDAPEVDIPSGSDMKSKIINGYGPKSPARKIVDRVMAEINDIHGDGSLPVISAVGTPNPRSRAEFRYSAQTGTANSIRIKNSTDAHLNMAHEVGHFIDHSGLGPYSNRFSSVPYARAWRMLERSGGGLGELEKSALANTDSDLKGWWEAVAGSATYQEIKERRFFRPGTPSHVRTYADYLFKPEELWARSYAQWIATKAPEGSPIKSDLRNMLERGRAAVNDPVVSDDIVQWPEKDFEPIAKAMDELFEGLGWLKK